MTAAPLPQDRLAATRQIHATLREYLAWPVWTPMQGILILAGIHPPSSVSDTLPSEGVGLDGKILKAGDERFYDARRILQQWIWRCEEDQEEGMATPVEMTPHEFIRWCEDMELQNDWLRVVQLMHGYQQTSEPIDLISPQLADYAAHLAGGMNAILSAATTSSAEAAPSLRKTKKRRKKAASSPIPIPENRDWLTNQECADVLGLQPTTLHKSHSVTGTYNGIRPFKLGTQLCWKVSDIKAYINAGQNNDD